MRANTSAWSSPSPRSERAACPWSLRSRRDVADHLGHLRTLPRQRRGARLLRDELGAGDLGRVALARRVRMLRVDLVAAGDDHGARPEGVQVAPGLERARARNGLEGIGERIGVLMG